MVEHTLIPSYKSSKKSKYNSPAARLGDGIDNVFELGRDGDGAKLGAGQRRGEASCVGSHVARR